MAYYNSAHISALRALVDYVRHEGDVELRRSSSQDGVPTFRADGHGLSSEPCLTTPHDDTYWGLCDRARALESWHRNLDELDAFLDHVGDALPANSFMNRPLVAAPPLFAKEEE